MIGRLAEISLAQPVDDCLKLLGRFLSKGKGHGPVMGSFWQPSNLLGSTAAGSDKVSQHHIYRLSLGVYSRISLSGIILRGILFGLSGTLSFASLILSRYK
jgi:hypothetical protein